MTILERLEDLAASHPSATAYTFLPQGDASTRSITWRELAHRVERQAGAVAAAAPSGARVLVAFPEGLDGWIAFLSALRAGVVAVPVPIPDSSRHIARLKAVAADCTPHAILAPKALHPQLAHIAPTLAPQEHAGPIHAPAAIAYLQYTSGSTASPRGVVIPHTQLMYQLQSFDLGYHHAGGTIVSWLPSTHDLGLVYGRFMGLYCGIHTVFFPPAAFLARPRRWLEVITRFRGTHSASPNFGYALTARRCGDLQGINLSTVRVFLNGAEPIQASTERDFYHTFSGCGLSKTALTHAMGMSEATAKIVSEPIDRPARFLRVALKNNRAERSTSPDSVEVASNGVPSLDTRIKIVDPNTGVALPAWHIGELWVTGSTVAAGYFQNQAATSERFGAQLDGLPYLRTGDLGFMVDGELYLVGRSKDVLILNGRNHYPEDIEPRVWHAHPSIRPGCVIAFSTQGPDSEVLCIAAEINPSSATAPQIHQCIQAALAPTGLSAAHILLRPPHTLPKTPSGKLQRGRMRDLFELPAPPQAAPLHGTPLQVLTQAAATALSIPPDAIDLDTPLRELGLDSVAAVELLSVVGDHFHRTYPVSWLFDFPTLRSLAAALTGERSELPEDIAAMTSAEAEAALLAELEDL